VLVEQLVPALRPQVVFGRVLVADTLAALGRLRNLPVIACVGVRLLQRESIVDEHPQLDELAVAVQPVTFDDVQLFGVHPSIGVEPRFRVEADGIDDERVVGLEASPCITVPRERHVARMR